LACVTYKTLWTVTLSVRCDDVYPAPSLNIASKSWVSVAVWWIKTCRPAIPASKWNGLSYKWLQPVRWNTVQSVCLPHYADNKTEVL
jgi:hypothetical protein